MKLSFRRHEMRVGTVCVSLLALAALPGLLSKAGLAEVVTRRFPVTTEMVLTAMRYRQLTVEGVQVSLAAPITSSTDNPMLDIQTVTQTSEHTAQLRVVCRNRTQCLPFYVAVTWPETATNISLPAKAFSRGEPSQTATQQAKDVSNAGVRAGAPATLLIEDEKVHIRLQVVCMQSGAAGDKVRVSTPDHKVSYKAEIVASNLLKGRF